jgi:hypothetical protein
MDDHSNDSTRSYASAWVWTELTLGASRHCHLLTTDVQRHRYWSFVTHALPRYQPSLSVALPHVLAGQVARRTPLHSLLSKALPHAAVRRQALEAANAAVCERLGLAPGALCSTAPYGRALDRHMAVVAVDAATDNDVPWIASQLGVTRQALKWSRLFVRKQLEANPALRVVIAELVAIARTAAEEAGTPPRMGPPVPGWLSAGTRRPTLRNTDP